MFRSFLFFYVIWIWLPFSMSAQHDALLSKIMPIAETAKGRVGVAVSNIESGDTLTWNGNAHCVMHSVFKFPIALTILSKIEEGKFSLNTKIYISKAEMVPDTWSPLRDKYPNGNISVSINDLLQDMVSQSDNVACDALLKKLDGPVTVENYIHQLGIAGFAMTATETDMRKSWDIQYNNWCTPTDMVKLLVNFYTGKILSKRNTALLKKIMEETTTGPNRLKGLLPKGTVVAHKTGTSETNDKGMTAATNDVGIISLPDGKHVAIAVFVNDAYADDKTRDLVIAKIAKEVCEGFKNK